MTFDCPACRSRLPALSSAPPAPSPSCQCVVCEWARERQDSTDPVRPGTPEWSRLLTAAAR